MREKWYKIIKRIKVIKYSYNSCNRYQEVFNSVIFKTRSVLEWALVKIIINRS